MATRNDRSQRPQKGPKSVARVLKCFSVKKLRPSQLAPKVYDVGWGGVVVGWGGIEDGRYTEVGWDGG